MNIGLVGLEEWQTVQRSWITLWTLPKSVPVALAWAGSAGSAACGLLSLAGAAALLAAGAACSW
ncbi:hypothetical protein D3C80_1953040 [compost metagenome]